MQDGEEENERTLQTRGSLLFWIETDGTELIILCGTSVPINMESITNVTSACQLKVK